MYQPRCCVQNFVFLFFFAPWLSRPTPVLTKYVMEDPKVKSQKKDKKEKREKSKKEEKKRRRSESKQKDEKGQENQKGHQEPKDTGKKRSRSEDKSSEPSKKKARVEKTTPEASKPAPSFLSDDTAALSKFRDSHRITIYGDVTNFAPIENFTQTGFAEDM